MHFFDTTRVMVAAQGLGLSEACLETSLRYVKERTAFGAPLGSFQMTQKKLTEMAIMIEALRGPRLSICLVHRHRPARLPPGGHGEVLQRPGGCFLCQWWGGAPRPGTGTSKNTPFPNGIGDAKILELYEGTKEAEILTIGRALQAK